MIVSFFIYSFPLSVSLQVHHFPLSSNFMCFFFFASPFFVSCPVITCRRSNIRVATIVYGNNNNMDNNKGIMIEI